MSDLSRRELEAEVQELQDRLRTVQDRLAVKKERIQFLEARQDRMADAMKTIRQWTDNESIEDLTEIYIDPSNL